MPRTALLTALLVSLLLLAAAPAGAQSKPTAGPGRSATPIGLVAVGILVAMASVGILRGRAERDARPR